MHIASTNNNVAMDEDLMLEKWGDADDVYLIVEQQRLPYWQGLLTERFHIYHQVDACGRHVILSNQL